MLENAKWICMADDFVTVAPIFKREIKTEKSIVKAVLTITSAGCYEAYINGSRVGNFVFAPGWTSFDKRLQVQEYDVTEMLEDENVLEVCVGEGWNLGRIGNNPRHYYMAKKPALILDLKIEYVDGTSENIVSDESFMCAASNVLFSGIYDGEIYDSRERVINWQPVAILDYPKSILIPQEGEEILEFEKIKPISVTKRSDGSFIVDFGQNLTGYVEFVCEEPEGTIVEIQHAEILTPGGNVYTENLRTAKQNIKFIANGKKTVYKPHFTYMGFRYVKVENMQVNEDNICAIVVHSNIKRTGDFKCSNEKLNQLYRNIIWSQRGNYLDVPMDCPQRDERLGWTGDCQMFMKAACYNYDVYKFFIKWLNDMKCDQYEHGGIPEIIPDCLDGRGSSSAGFGDAAVICPWILYLYYGDKSVLENQFDCMEKWILYIKAQGDNPYLWNTGFHFGDWLALDAEEGSYIGATPKALVATAYYAYSTSLLIKAGEVIGKDMSEYRELHKNVVNAFREEFVKDGLLTSTTQTAYALAIMFDLVENVQEYGDILDRLIKENGGKLSTGFIGTPNLLRALTKTGHLDTAYSLLLREEYPSWLYAVNLGATTVWEHWDGLKEDGKLWSADMNSFNHYSYGSVCDWMFEFVAGIGIDESKVGFENVILAPRPDRRLEWAQASFDTKYGKVTSKWKINGNKVEYEFVVPHSATLVLDGVKTELGKGEYKFEGEI